MINFELDGAQYRIDFKHYSREQLLLPEIQERLSNFHKPLNGVTCAFLLKREGDKWQVESSGVAFCMFVDPFSKAKGRQLSLKRLLDSASLFCDTSIGLPGLRNRDLRLKIWRLYFDKVRGAEAEKFWVAQLKQSQNDAQ